MGRARKEQRDSLIINTEAEVEKLHANQMNNELIRVAAERRRRNTKTSQNSQQKYNK